MKRADFYLRRKAGTVLRPVFTNTFQSYIGLPTLFTVFYFPFAIAIFFDLYQLSSLKYLQRKVHFAEMENCLAYERSSRRNPKLVPLSAEPDLLLRGQRAKLRAHGTSYKTTLDATSPPLPGNDIELTATLRSTLVTSPESRGRSSGPQKTSATLFPPTRSALAPTGTPLPRNYDKDDWHAMVYLYDANIMPQDRARDEQLTSNGTTSSLYPSS